MMERHEQWMAQYGREYKNITEKEERYTIFKANVEYIDFVNNAGGEPYKLECKPIRGHNKWGIQVGLHVI